ncbi:hypothetical protein PoB_006696500 [Plakobranchus ocellatus]|uniref:Uncharacterized protein n=1 Tax=Plakobranchus ocellatus TaxID=259542 RepID=A0AAV4D8S2_9GAST|nr:hypothetical protein PoB_006696500 [Plakobranchus ocellatus]
MTARDGQESVPIATAESVSAQMVTTEKEGGEKFDSVTNREPLRLHLNNSFIEILRAVEHQMLPTMFNIRPPPSPSHSLQSSLTLRPAHFYDSMVLFFLFVYKSFGRL